MTPAPQTVLYGEQAMGNGNCYTACLASLLDLPIWMVPPFEQMFARPDRDKRINRWLEQFFKLKRVVVDGHQIDKLPEFYMAAGHTIRKSYHAVIYSKGVLAHDPHFSGDGLIAVDYTTHLESV